MHNLLLTSPYTFYVLIVSGNNYPEEMKPGMAFTIEPLIMEGPDIVCRADDNWTIFTQNHTR